MIYGLQVGLEGGYFGQDGRLQIFVDGEAIPSIDVDLGTVFCGHYDARTSTLGPIHSMHIMSDYYGSARPSAMSGMFRYPIPYSNGDRSSSSRTSSNVDITTGNQISGQGYGFATIEYREGAGVIVGSQRLRSWCRPRVNAQAIAVGASATFFTAPQVSGYILYLCVRKPGFILQLSGEEPLDRHRRRDGGDGFERQPDRDRLERQRLGG